MYLVPITFAGIPDNFTSNLVRYPETIRGGYTLLGFIFPSGFPASSISFLITNNALPQGVNAKVPLFDGSFNPVVIPVPNMATTYGIAAKDPSYEALFYGIKEFYMVSSVAIPNGTIVYGMQELI